MANDLLLQALEECRARQIHNEAEERRRMARASGLCPRIAELDALRREDVLQGLQQAIQGIRPEGITERTAARNAQIEALLMEHGFPADYLEPVVQCPACRDSGYTGNAPKALCACVTRRYHQLLAGGDMEAEGPSFERFDLEVFPQTVLDRSGTTQRMAMQVIRRHCERFADTLPEGPRNLLLYGPSGLVKTYLLRCIAGRARGRGIQTLALKQRKELLRRAYFAREEDSTSPITTCRCC